MHMINVSDEEACEWRPAACEGGVTEPPGGE